jgi:hypothetical protein
MTSRRKNENEIFLEAYAKKKEKKVKIRNEEENERIIIKDTKFPLTHFRMQSHDCLLFNKNY